MVNFICSEWIPSENIPFKIGIFIDWKVVRLPPEGGRLGYWMVKHLITIYSVVGVVGVVFMVWRRRYFVSPFGDSH